MHDRYSATRLGNDQKHIWQPTGHTATDHTRTCTYCTFCCFTLIVTPLASSRIHVHIYTSSIEPVTCVLPRAYKIMYAPYLLSDPCHPVFLFYYTTLLLHSLMSFSCFLFPTLCFVLLSFVSLPPTVVKVIHRRRGDPHPRCSNAVSVSGRSHRVFP